MRVPLVDDPRAEVGEDVRVGVRVGPMEFQLHRLLNVSRSRNKSVRTAAHIGNVTKGRLGRYYGCNK